MLFILFYTTHFLLHNHIAILCLIFGLVSLIADLRCPDEAADFFGNDVLQSYEDYFAGKEWYPAKVCVTFLF